MDAKKSKHEPDEFDSAKIAAIFSYIPFLCFIPLLSYPQNKYVLKHGKQGLLLLIIEVIALIFLIDFVSYVFWALILLLCFIFAVIGIFMVISGKEWKIPYIGNIFEKYEI